MAKMTNECSKEALQHSNKPIDFICIDLVTYNVASYLSH